ncbi:hypothetical protein CMI37_24645 [Candidatus Pacearchaeota archaeon]|nr:hypothetical protein [Candidatus Pacearchaeota archaeon]|tara:strand:- start:4408 stop:4773 length:366 start_codon:yes stop_codon:yes gene_type:complete
MALKVAGYSSSALSYKIVHQSAVTQTADVDVLGTGGTMSSIDVHNAHSSTIYLKMFLSSGTYTAGASEPDLMFRMPASTQKRFDLPSGISFNQLTFWTNSAAATNSTAAPGGTVSIIIVST